MVEQDIHGSHITRDPIVGIMIVETGFGACCLCRDVMMNDFQMKHLEKDSI